MIENVAITGACRPTPLSSSMSRVESWRSITPTTRNSADLNSAWLSSSARPASAASRVPKPSITVRKPSWLTVPNASTRLRSVSRRACTPPSSIVKTPSAITIGRQGPASANAGASRASR